MDQSLTDQLFDILEEFITEIQAHKAALHLAKRYLPEAAQRELDQLITDALSDPVTLDTVHQRLDQYRKQPLAQTLAELRQERQKRVKD